MKKTSNMITIQTFILFCTFALPSISLYCQSSPRNSSASTRRARKTGVAPVEIAQEEIPEENEEKTEPIRNSKPLKTTTKQTRSITATPSTWRAIYNLLPHIFVQSFSTGSDAGIGAFTKTLTKQLMTRHSFLSKKNEALNLIEDLSQKNQVTYLEDTKTDLMSGYFAANKLDFEHLEKQTSIPVILGTTASSALIYTISTMMGSLIKIGIGIALQLIMPQSY